VTSHRGRADGSRVRRAVSSPPRTSAPTAPRCAGARVVRVDGVVSLVRTYRRGTSLRRAGLRGGTHTLRVAGTLALLAHLAPRQTSCPARSGAWRCASRDAGVPTARLGGSWCAQSATSAALPLVALERRSQAARTTSGWTATGDLSRLPRHLSNDLLDPLIKPFACQNHARLAQGVELR
jgi:hypothetical protein